MGRSRAAFYSRSWCANGSPRIMSFASAGGAISVTTLVESDAERAHPPARGFALAATARYAVANIVAVKPRVIPPQRKQDATQAPRQGDDRDASPAPRGEPIDPGPQGRTGGMAPTDPRGLNQQAAQLARSRFRDVAAMPALGGAVFARHQAERGADLAGVRKALVVIDKGAERRRDNQADARHSAQPRDDRIGSPSASGAARPAPESRSSTPQSGGTTAPAFGELAATASRATRAGTVSQLPVPSR